jgi:uncharacterized membrane protein YkvA (DUF1232 family)
MFSRWKHHVRQLKTELYALYLAMRDPRMPWYARLWVALVVGYAFSPIDLIPDPIPVLGYLDDLVLLPLGIVIALRLIPAPVLADCRLKAHEAMQAGRPTNWIAAGVIVVIWILLIVAALWVIRQAFM